MGPVLLRPPEHGVQIEVGTSTAIVGPLEHVGKFSRMIIAIRKLLWDEIRALKLLVVMNKSQKTSTQFTKNKLPLEIREL